MSVDHKKGWKIIRKTHIPEQIINKLGEAESDIAEVSRKIGIIEPNLLPLEEPITDIDLPTIVTFDVVPPMMII